MKKILTILVISLFLFSCSSDDDTTVENTVPTIENITPTVANIGDVITINGSNFHTNQNYINTLSLFGVNQFFVKN